MVVAFPSWLKCSRSRVAAALLLSAAFGLGARSATGRSSVHVIVQKEARRLSILQGDRTLKTYRIALGRQPRGRKECQGDDRTPEGSYIIDSRNRNSGYHRALHVSYPNAADRKAAEKKGCNPGGDIMIHGLPNGYGWLGRTHTARDWTQGCIAVTNAEIEEIWKLVPNGTRLEIRP